MAKVASSKSPRSCKAREHRPLGSRAPWRVVTILLSLLLATAAAANGPVAFSTTGGEAWTFEKQIEATVDEDRCDIVVITSPRTSVAVRPQGGRVRAHVPLLGGGNRITAECRRNDRVGGAARQDWNVRLRDVPKARIGMSATESGIVLDATGSEKAPARAEPIVRNVWSARKDNPGPIAGLPAHDDRVSVPAPSVDGEYNVTLEIADAAGRRDRSTATFRVQNGRAQPVDSVRERPSWINGAVVYGVVPPLFGKRGIADVTAHLDRLAALGVNTLWLAPITASPQGDFGYAVTDYFRVRPSYGSDADLRALIAAAHARGIRVIMDFVPNHLSDRHAYFMSVQARAHASPYFDFFARDASGSAVHYFEWNNLKNLNFDNPEVRSLVIEAFAYWVREFDIDGFRVDVAWGPRQRAPDFWPSWRAELKRIKPDLMLLAEASIRDPYYGRNGFDAAYDWTEKLGEWAWRDAFDSAAPARSLRAAISASLSDTPVMRFLENNDTGARFITRYGPGRTRVASAMLFTLPGIPSLYTGQEVGAAYEPYETSAPITWDGPHGLQPWYARLIALRHAYPALRSQELTFLETDAADHVLVYLRGGEQDGILVLLNYGEKAAEFEEYPAAMIGRPLVDLLTGNGFIPERGKPLQLPPHDVRIFKLN